MLQRLGAKSRTVKFFELREVLVWVHDQIEQFLIECRK